MTKQKIIDDLQAENQKLYDCLNDYQVRHDAAINALADLAAGYGRNDHNGKWSAAYLAKEELARIAKMILRKTP